jgi:predicted regulator of Ras-like GTPase activity (Roadblock/LC7/MglB family)
MKKALQEVLGRIPGALGAAVVGLDGIAVEKAVVPGGLNIDLIAAEGINVVKRALASLRDPSGGPIEEIAVTSRSRLVIMRSLGHDYFLCVVVGPDAVAGRARYEAWKAGLELQQAIA